MREFVHDTPASRVVFGVGSRRRVSAEVDHLGATRVLLVAGSHEQTYADDLAADLGERLAGRFTDIAMHVPVEVARAAAAAAAEVDADCLLALGGGSAIGTAKAVARESGLPIVAVPTTYAGSEMTPIWGLTESGRKTTGRDLRVLPAAVVYDPELTLSLPADLSAASGMNALAHLVEALYAPAVSPVVLLAAEEGVTALARALPGVVADPTDITARSEAMYGAWLAGWALGVCGMGVHHKICHALGGTWNLPHAQTHSAVLAYATAFNADAAPDAMAAHRPRHGGRWPRGRLGRGRDLGPRPRDRRPHLAHGRGVSRRCRGPGGSDGGRRPSGQPAPGRPGRGDSPARAGARRSTPGRRLREPLVSRLAPLAPRPAGPLPSGSWTRGSLRLTSTGSGRTPDVADSRPHPRLGGRRMWPTSDHNRAAPAGVGDRRYQRGWTAARRWRS